MIPAQKTWFWFQLNGRLFDSEIFEPKIITKKNQIKSNKKNNPTLVYTFRHSLNHTTEQAKQEEEEEAAKISYVIIMHWEEQREVCHL